jgi:hypothetical protein
MAYFDDPANRESWENAMGALREERARRLSGEAASDFKAADLHAAGRQRAATREPVQEERIPVSFKQLLEEDAAERGVSAVGRSPEKSAGATKEKQFEVAP